MKTKKKNKEMKQIFFGVVILSSIEKSDNDKQKNKIWILGGLFLALLFCCKTFSYFAFFFLTIQNLVCAIF